MMSRILGSFAFLLLFCLPVLGAEKEKPAPASRDHAAEEAGTDAANVEPSLRPENRSVEGLSVEVSADGVEKAELRERFSHALVLRIAPDGSKRLECVDDHAHLQELLKARQRDQATSEDGE